MVSLLVNAMPLSAYGTDLQLCNPKSPQQAVVSHLAWLASRFRRSVIIIFMNIISMKLRPCKRWTLGEIGNLTIPIQRFTSIHTNQSIRVNELTINISILQKVLLNLLKALDPSNNLSAQAMCHRLNGHLDLSLLCFVYLQIFFSPLRHDTVFDSLVASLDISFDITKALLNIRSYSGVFQTSYSGISWSSGFHAVGTCV